MEDGRGGDEGQGERELSRAREERETGAEWVAGGRREIAIDERERKTVEKGRMKCNVLGDGLSHCSRRDQFGLSLGSDAAGRIADGVALLKAVVPVGDVGVIGQHGPHAGPSYSQRPLKLDVPHRNFLSIDLARA